MTIPIPNFNVVNEFFITNVLTAEEVDVGPYHKNKLNIQGTIN